VTDGITTWDDLGQLDGNVLAILNSPVDDGCAVDALFEQLGRCVPLSAIHVIAEPAWRASLSARGFGDDRTLLTIDDQGREIELNHFLETPAVVKWAVSRSFRTIVGSSVHGLYNEEVKEVFEQRVCVLLGDGRFLAHTLPGPYVFIFDLAGMLQRAARKPKAEAYSATCRALLDDLFCIWRQDGASTSSDDAGFDDVIGAMARHLGAAVLAFDEASAIPLPHGDAAAGMVALVRHFQQVLFERDAHLAALSDLCAERTAAVDTRDEIIAELHAERVSAVNLRDTIIDSLRREHEPLVRRWRRWLRSGQ
jgi:hypothetical protein